MTFGFALLFSPCFSFAGADVPVQIRLFVGSTTAAPTQLNDELVNQSIEKIKNTSRYGLESSYQMAPRFNLGLNYTGRQADENGTGSSTNDEKLKQDSFSAVAHLALVKNDFMLWDIFGSGGAASTSMTLNAASASGTLKNNYSSVVSTYGTTFAFGYKKYFFLIEGGYETNKVGSLKRTGSVNQSVKNIDLSGSFVNIGLLIDGLPTSFGPSTSSSK
jgi:hypothetical protein